MTSIHANSDIVVFGALHWKQEWLDKSRVTIHAGEIIPLTNGMKFKSTRQWNWRHTNTSNFNNVILAVTLPSDHNFNTIPELIHQREASNYELVPAESAGSMYQALVSNIKQYTEYWHGLTKAERDALVYGIAATAGGAITGWKTAAFIADLVTPGGPAFPFFGLCEAAISGAVTYTATNAHLEAINTAQNYARSAEASLVKMKNAAMELGIISEDTRIYTPEIKSFTDIIAKFYKGTPFNNGESYSRPTSFQSMRNGAMWLPAYRSA